MKISSGQLNGREYSWKKRVSELPEWTTGRQRQPLATVPKIRNIRTWGSCIRLWIHPVLGPLNSNEQCYSFYPFILCSQTILLCRLLAIKHMDGCNVDTIRINVDNKKYIFFVIYNWSCWWTREKGFKYSCHL